MDKKKFKSKVKDISLIVSLVYVVVQLVILIPWKSSNIDARYTVADQAVPRQISEFLNKEQVQNYLAQIPKEYKPLLHSVEYYTSTSYKYINLTIENNSNKEIESLRLESEISGIYQIERTSEKINTGDIDGALNLGNLRPSNKIKISIWGSIPFAGDSEFIKITHKNGYFIPIRGAYVFSWLKDIDSFFNAIKGDALLGFVFVLMVLALLYIILDLIIRISRVKKRKQQQPVDVVEPEKK